MVGMSTGVGTSGVVCVNGRDVYWCGDFWSSVCEWWTQSNTTSILLASTPSMPPSWSMTDPSGRPLFADCQRSNPSMALKSSKSSV